MAQVQSEVDRKMTTVIEGTRSLADNKDISDSDLTKYVLIKMIVSWVGAFAKIEAGNMNLMMKSIYEDASPMLTLVKINDSYSKGFDLVKAGCREIDAILAKRDLHIIAELDRLTDEFKIKDPLFNEASKVSEEILNGKDDPDNASDVIRKLIDNLNILGGSNEQD